MHNFKSPNAKTTKQLITQIESLKMYKTFPMDCYRYIHFS